MRRRRSETDRTGRRGKDLEVPVENRIGEEGKGFRYILSGMNAERILLASESIGELSAMVQQMQRSVAGFKLPGIGSAESTIMQDPDDMADAVCRAGGLSRLAARRV